MRTRPRSDPDNRHSSVHYPGLSYFLARSGSLFLTLAALTLAGCAVLDPRQVNPPAPGIARTETIRIDGLPERLLIRGRDPAHNPVLLFIHGGPGFPGAVFQATNSGLERDFTVVHWDQRGAGYSYFPGIPIATMNVEQFVRETLAVTRHLCQEFGQQKIYLVGHSWGTLPAALAVAREPARFYAYVALSQLVDVDESERRLAAAALYKPRGPHALRLATQLRALGPPPYLDLPTQDRAARLIRELLPPVPGAISSFRLALLALSSRYYPLPALLHAYHSYRYSSRLLDPQLHPYDLRRQVPEIDVPVYFFVGRGDAEFGVTIQQEYFRKLLAPKGKHFVLFSDSTHWPHLEQPATFLTEMERVRRETLPANAAHSRPSTPGSLSALNGR